MNACNLGLVLLVLPACVLGTDLVLQKADRAEPANPTVTHSSVLKAVGGKAHLGISANGYFATFENALPHFRAPGPKGGSPCGKRTRTSVTARANNCSYATNASPFNMDTGACDCGVSVTGGVAYGTGGFRPGLGTTAQGDWVIGTLNSTLIDSLNVSEFAVGFSWLVRAGKNVAPTGSFVAPRTAIGTTADGRLLSLEVDGCEQSNACKFNLGKNESDMAQLLIAHGAFHAINLDGGGSSSVVQNGKVINHPTDTDAWLLKKERAVTTIVCIQ